MVEACTSGGHNTQLVCADGICITFRREYKCPEHPCVVGDQECENKVQCFFSAYDKCDGSRDCDDGSDEANCQLPDSNGLSSLPLPKEVLLIVLIVVSFVVLCTVLSIYIYCRRNNQRNNVREDSLRMHNEIPFVAADNIAGVPPGPPMCPSHINLPRVPCCPAHVSAIQSLLGHNGAAAPYISSEEQPFIHPAGRREWMEDLR